jgi:FKBP-type peptidyl-prolyl cis-trans isomerase SlyD
MNIQNDTAVTLRIFMTDVGTRPPVSSNEVIAYLHGGYENIFPKLQAALDGQAVGFKTTLELTPEDTYGPRDPALAMSIPKRTFPPGVKVGGQIELPGDDGHMRHYFVMKIKGDQVLLDANHPLAGKTLRLTVTVLDVRAATAEEIEHRHVHGAHGHHH